MKMAHIELAQRSASATGHGARGRRPHRVRHHQSRQERQGVRKIRGSYFALEHNLPIDTKHYLDQFSPPLLRIFEPIVHNAASVLLR